VRISSGFIEIMHQALLMFAFSKTFDRILKHAGKTRFPEASTLALLYLMTNAIINLHIRKLPIKK